MATTPPVLPVTAKTLEAVGILAFVVVIAVLVFKLKVGIADIFTSQLPPKAEAGAETVN